MIIALGVARAAPGRLAELLDACGRVAEESRQDQGCLDYGFHASISDPDLITSVEIWHSQDALDAHLHHEHTRRFLDAVSGLTDGEPHMQLLKAEPAP
ncbi:putative quinol monooxygenase [Pseudarthrobacter scleromae]|uniref:putative quinol monooxygenase n=1 Tax=Pseudarthrobacter scleromae TaxID=158897 RepID=UPI003D01E6A9